MIDLARHRVQRVRAENQPPAAATSQSAAPAHAGLDFILEATRDIDPRVFEFYPPLRRTRELVKEKFGEPISLADAAKVAGLERKYFSTYFSAKVGISFRSWLSSIRVQEAIELIQSEDDNLTNIGARVGFQDMRTFERNFKRFTGRTPSDVKRQLAPQPPKKVRLSAEAQ